MKQELQIIMLENCLTKRQADQVASLSEEELCEAAFYNYETGVLELDDDILEYIDSVLS